MSITRQLRVVNVVCTLFLGRVVDPMLCCMATSGKLCKATFPADISKSRTSTSCSSKWQTSTNCLFKSGKLVNTGSVDCLGALLSVSSFIDRLNRDMGYDLEICNFDVENIVGATRLPHTVNLNLLLADGADLHDRKWEPELFPGLKLECPGIVFIIFTSGNIIATGAGTINQMPEAEAILAGLRLDRYIIGNEYRSLKGVPILNTPAVRVKKAKKPEQFKVINYAKKKALYKESVQSHAPKSGISKKRHAAASTKPKKRSAVGASRQHVTYQRMEALELD